LVGAFVVGNADDAGVNSGSVLPEPVRPMMATAGPAPTGPGWAWEWKWDGVRAIVAVAPGAAVRAMSRNDRDITGSYPELLALTDLVDQPVLLDGELVALDPHGRPNFGRLQSRMHVRHPSDALLGAVPVQYYAFDLLQLGTQRLLSQPYVRRRQLLDDLRLDGGPVQVPAYHTDVDGSTLLELAGQHGLEGVVAKRLQSRYEPGRRVRFWIKTPLRHTQEVVIGGWRPGQGRRADTIGALLLGAYDQDGNLIYVGDVGTGFTEQMLRDLHAMLQLRERPTSPFLHVPRELAQGAHWVQPDLVGEVEHRQLTTGGHLRHPSWRGLRPDRDPREIIFAVPPS
jgi:bifunctional non-homologous end joining protein LigD